MFLPRYENRQAVKDVSFSIERGEMVGFIGPNGAGKSTTVKMLSGILYPDSGEIRVNGLVPYRQRKSYVKRIGVVFGQKSQLQWDLPVIDSFELLKAIYRVPDEVYRNNLGRYTEMLDMAGFIREMNVRDKVTMLFTTHDMQDIEKTCKRLIIIDRGAKVYDGSLSGVRDAYGTTRQLDVEFCGECEIAPIRDVEICDAEGGNSRKKRFIFENKKVPIQELMNYLLTNYSVRDLYISEPEIESIIRKIYSGEV